jgi:hypothetical protein
MRFRIVRPLRTHLILSAAHVHLYKTVFVCSHYRTEEIRIFKRLRAQKITNFYIRFNSFKIIPQTEIVLI